MPTIPTEPIRSIPRPAELIEPVATRGFTDPALDPLDEQATRDTIERFEAPGSPVIAGKPRKYHNFWEYCVEGLPNTAPDGFKIPSAAGHDRRMLDYRVFVGVVAPMDPRVEVPEQVRDRVLEAAKYIPVEQLVTTDDCGYAPFCDGTSTPRDTAFAKIRARVLGTAVAASLLGGGQ